MQQKRTAPLAGGYVTRNTVRALERLAVRSYSAPELADELRVDIRTVRRLLKRLAIEDYVVQETGHRRRYRTTLKLVAIAAPMLTQSPLPEVALDALSELANATGGVAHLWVAGGSGPFCLAHALPRDRRLQVSDDELEHASRGCFESARWRGCGLREDMNGSPTSPVVDLLAGGHRAASVSLTNARDPASAAAAADTADQISRELFHALLAAQRER